MLRLDRSLSLALLACAGSVSCAQPARYILSGELYSYGFFGKGATVDVFGPVEDSFGLSYPFPANTPDKQVNTMIGAAGGGGAIAIDLLTETRLNAQRLAGNDFGGGIDINIDVYVKGPPNTPFFVRQVWAGSSEAIHGSGAGRTDAKSGPVISSVVNGGGRDFDQYNTDTGRVFGGFTSTAPHPSSPDHFLATTVGRSQWGYTFQSIDFCFPGCPAILDFDTNSFEQGAVIAGPCCPGDDEIDLWNYDPSVPGSTPMFQLSNNCYNFGVNRANPFPIPLSDANGNFDGFYQSQPGNPTPGPIPSSETNCQDIATRMASDGVTPTTFGDPNSCAPGDCVIALVIMPPEDSLTGDPDYHFYRRNRDGTWEHKIGSTEATILDSSGNPINDPRDADRRQMDRAGNIVEEGYTEFCGFYCVPCEFDLPLPPGPPGGGPPAPTDPLLATTILTTSGRIPPSFGIDTNDPVLLAQLQMAIDMAPITTERPRPPGLGYQGIAVQPLNGIAGFPEYVRVVDGVLEIFDDNTIEYRADIIGLEQLLIQAAGDAGLGDIFTPACLADLSSPDNPGVPDGALTGADFFEFLSLFSAGDLAVDFSGATTPGVPDGALTGADFFEFLSLFSAGC